MNSEIIKTILDIIKLAPRYMILVTVICGALLFMSEGFSVRLGVKDLVDSQRQWLGIGLVVSVSIWGVSIFSFLWNWASGKYYGKKIHNMMIEKLCSLTENEKQILRYYLATDSRANTLKIDDGVVQELVRKRIIFQSASLGNMMEGFAHNINEAAWDYLHVHPHVLDGNTNTYRTDKREDIW